MLIPLPSTSFIILAAIGCVESFSAEPAYASSCSSVVPSGIISATVKFPSVTVPVLSITTALILARVSNETPPLKSIPLFEPAPIPAKNANGTLRTNAQGQLITRNVSAV